jgi:hypothetical protein
MLMQQSITVERFSETKKDHVENTTINESYETPGGGGVRSQPQSYEEEFGIRYKKKYKNINRSERTRCRGSVTKKHHRI